MWCFVNCFFYELEDKYVGLDLFFYNFFLMVLQTQRKYIRNDRQRALPRRQSFSGRSPNSTQRVQQDYAITI